MLIPISTISGTGDPMAASKAFLARVNKDKITDHLAASPAAGVAVVRFRYTGADEVAYEGMALADQYAREVAAQHGVNVVRAADVRGKGLVDHTYHFTNEDPGAAKIALERNAPSIASNLLKA
jgi:hypothetical protein